MSDQENLEIFKILCEEYSKYLFNVRKVCMESYQSSVGTPHELSTRTAANCTAAIYARWESAFKSATEGTPYEFPTNLSVDKEQPSPHNSEPEDVVE
jgi:hypothetical protein